MPADNSASASFVPTNASIYFQIARDSHERMTALQEAGRRPKPDGEPGWIITYDPSYAAFKQALIVIVFCGTYLEALFHLLIVRYHGVDEFKRLDKKADADKFALLGCTDDAIVDGCAHFKKARKEIVHEKAHLDSGAVRLAQVEATSAFKFITALNAHFGIDQH